MSKKLSMSEILKMLKKLNMSDLDKQLYLYKQLIQVVGLDVYQYHSGSVWGGNELSHTVRKMSLNLRVLRAAIPKPYSK